MPLFRRQSVSELSKSATEDQHSTDAKSQYKRQDQSQTKRRIAIIGSGVSGLTCAHYLSQPQLAKRYEVTVFEAGDYIGGHVNTIDIELQDGKKAKAKYLEKSAIDTGFIVFNERTYPNFFRLLHDLQVPFQATDMSFSVKNTARNFEYNGHTLNTLLSQRRNALNPKFWQFIKDILRFNKHIKQLRQDFEQARASGKDTSVFTEQTLGSYLISQNYHPLFTDNYLLPMVSAIWSTGLDDVQDFPLVFFAQFFDNHGLLDVVNRPQWFTIKGGSKQYVNKLMTRFVKAGGTVQVSRPVRSVTRDDNQVTLIVANKTNDNLQELIFDEVIFACHADTALSLLQDASSDETQVLSHFQFTKNTAVLHTDTSVLPKKPLAWASWNYLINDKLDQKLIQKNKQAKNKPSLSQQTTKPVLTYHMNILQRLTKSHNYLVTLNPATLNTATPNNSIDDAQIIKSIDYSHPIFDKQIVAAQHDWAKISGTGLHTHFCGAYWFNGFHEDGVRSGLRVCQALGSTIDIKDDVGPSHLPDGKAAHTPFRYKDLPIRADKNLRKLSKRQVVTATTNQELVDYIATLQASIPSVKKKGGWFGHRKVKS
ncbi:NAD(P)/FAD-dependent oxidoreductase [uncultured Psychrobacter sp.]|uniref:NAD(P)/FAD-dependent oxidoreductase n=1 Tax=uncultured Psychrobacter sp. TaxID=259303 RepID=UPI00345A9565